MRKTGDKEKQLKKFICKTIGQIIEIKKKNITGGKKKTGN